MVFADLASEMTFAREETFGSILSVIPLDDFEDAIQIASGNQDEFSLNNLSILRSHRMSSESIGFIGLGGMGYPIASNLLSAGYKLCVYNRTASKADTLVAQGALRATSPAEVAETSEIIITMLTGDRAVQEVAMGENGILDKLRQGAVQLSLSTISPALARNLSQLHSNHGSAYVSATVFGRPEAAAAKKLFICLSGEQTAIARVHPLLQNVSQRLFEFGEEPAAANVVKLCGNFLIGSAMEAIAEALTLAEKSGVDPTALIAMLSQTIFACPVYQNFGPAIAQRNHEPGVELKLALKDLNLVLQTAADTATPMPLASLLNDRLLSAVAKGREHMDWSALALGVSDDAGLS
jgi:3-hydroxyisobutyrate dehydrogenase-like beta-hydroxyacid dehydrogenase